jgi:predicted exporter
VSLFNPRGNVAFRVAFRVAIWLAVLGISLWVGLRSEFRADISAFLPRNPTPDQQLLVDQLKDGAVSRLILVAVDGNNPTTIAAISKQMLSKLRSDTQWTVISNGELVGADKDGKFLLENRYLLSTSLSSSSFTTEELKKALQKTKQMLSQETGFFAKALVPRDPTGEMIQQLEFLAARSQTPTEEGVWMVQPSPGQWRALIMGQTKAPGIDLDAQQAAVNAIKANFKEANDKHANGAAQLVLTGPGVFSALSRDRIRSEVTIMSTIATVMVVALIWWVYRSIPVMGLGLLPVATGIIVGMAAVAALFGHVHGLTLGFGATLIGEAIDYAIYLLTLIRNKPGQTAVPTMQRIWPTLRIGVLTSVFGFAAMVASDFPGLQQLGVFSVAGLIAAVLTARYLLPHLVPAGFEIRASGFGGWLANITRGLPRYRTFVNIALAITVIAAFTLPKKSTESGLGGVSPISVAEQKIDETLRGQLGAPDLRYLVIAQAANIENALILAERASTAMEKLQAEGNIASFDTPTRFLPSQALQKQRQAAIPATEVLSANLKAAAIDTGFNPESFQPFLDEIALAKTGNLISRKTLENSQLAAQVDALVVEKKNLTSVMLPLRDVKNETALRSAIAAINVPEIRVLDLTTETSSLYQTYRYQSMVYALAGMVAIFVLFLLYLRSIKRAIRLMWPLVAAVLWTASILTLSGITLSIFHIVALLLVVGVGSNYALFFDGQVNEVSLGPVMISLVVCNLSTLFGFGVLGFSNMPVLSAIGVTVGIGAALCLVLSALYLQAKPSNAK